ncbi:MAG: discoidin domain-containing protein [Candidatus Hydrogenedentes bacterium]|nr:discoidin domain-containing protein [Candidatus Hydrogenedentota bacterium]
MRRLVWVLALCAAFGLASTGAEDFADGFANPPDVSKPHTFWHWMNGNVTKEGITADLQAMHDAGIGGVFLFIVEGKVTESVPVYVDKPVRILTPEWFEMLRHAVSECKRLGMELSLMNCTGWTTSGGPWITPDKSMMRIAWSEKYVKGPGRVAEPLPTPPCDYANYQNLTFARPHIRESAPPEERYYRDVAVVAYRLDPSAARTAALWPPKLSCSEADATPAHAVDADGNTTVDVKENGYVQFDFGEPVTVRGVEYLGGACQLEASDDAATWRTIAQLPAPRQWNYPQTLPVPETSARYFRVSYPGGGSLVDIELSGDALVQDYQPKASFHGVWEDIKVAEDRVGPATPEWAKTTIHARDVVNLTDHLRNDGTLDWIAPKGDWMVVRFGCAPIGRLNAPCAREFAGLECNKLDPDAVAYHFNHYAGRVSDELKDYIGDGLNAIHVDSWEAGDENFTPKFIDEFRARRGYDPTPYLLVHGGGRVVDSPTVSDRFLWDVRRTLADLLSDNYFGKLNDLCHERGLRFQGEIAGVMVQTTADQLQIKGRCDLPMGEFQMPNCVYGDNWARWDTRETASGAHIYDRPIAAAEAFTTFDHWMTDPYGLKGIGDLAFSMGINRLVFHTWAHHPWLDRAPGMTMGPFGVNFSRMNTWSGRPMTAYIDYLRRCEFMLQQGRYVADVLYFYGEGAPNTLPAKPLIAPALPDGYSYDACDAETLKNRVRVNNGRVELPSGMGYRVLVLKDDRRMTPDLLAKVRELVKAGATVIGPKPMESPSLTDYPRCDDVVRMMADDLWGDIDGANVTQHTFGKGRVIWGTPVGDVLRSMKVAPDVEITPSAAPIEWIHRFTDEADLYFLTNQSNIIDHGVSLEIWERRYDSFAIDERAKDTVAVDVSFRVSGKQPELWDPVSGTQRDITSFRVEDNRTLVPLALPPSGSCFVVFRRPIDPTKPHTNPEAHDDKIAVELKGPWEVHFNPRWGGPDAVTFDTLEDWTARAEPGIRNYSGRATYVKTFDADNEICTSDGPVYLDLGALRSVAEIRLNGKDLGVLWCPPWRVDITELLKPTGNKLEIDITNVWANRILGDLDLPEEQRLTWTSLQETIAALKPGQKLVPSGLYGPVTITIER